LSDEILVIFRSYNSMKEKNKRENKKKQKKKKGKSPGEWHQVEQEEQQPAWQMKQDWRCNYTSFFSKLESQYHLA